MGLIYATIGEHEAAVRPKRVLRLVFGSNLTLCIQVESFMAATSLDKYLAVACVSACRDLTLRVRRLINPFADTSNVASAISSWAGSSTPSRTLKRRCSTCVATRTCTSRCYPLDLALCSSADAGASDGADRWCCTIVTDLTLLMFRTIQ